jgi:hypothetical protein
MKNNTAHNPWKRIIRTTGLILLGIIVLALAFFFHPQPLFRWSVKTNNLTLYSDQAFLPEDGRKVLEQVQNKIAASSLYSLQDHFSIFICNTKWRRSFYFVAAPGAGGVVYYPLSTNVFLSGADIAQNRLISPSGKPDLLGRKLDHFMAHEITHDLTGEALSWQQYRNLPVWIREGYAEYIGSQGVFKYDKAVEAYQTGSPEMNTPASIPYRRYNLLVAYLLEQKKWSPLEMFETTPTQSEVETMLKTELLNKNKQ